MKKNILFVLMLGPVFHAVTAQTKDSAAVYVSMGAAQAASKNYDQAIEFYFQALKFDPAVKGVYRAIGDIYYTNKNDIPSAKGFYEKELEINPNDAESWLQLGYGYYVNRDFDLAVTNAKKALAVWKYPNASLPAASSALNLIGNVYVATKDTANAKQSFMQAVKLNRREIPARKNLARLDEIEGKYNDAKNLYLEVIGLDPGDAQARLSLANIYFYQDAVIPAALEYVTALLLKPELENAKENPIQIFQFISKNKRETLRVQALVDSLSDTLVEGDLKPPQAFTYRAAIGYASLYYLNNPSAAINQYQIALKIKPETERINFYLGEAYFQLNKLPEAYEYYSKYSLHVADSYNYAKCFLMMGKILIKEKKFEGAQLQIIKSLKIYPNAESYFYYALALRGAYQTDEAVAAFEKAVKIFPQYTDAYVELGRTHLTAKKYDKALVDLQKAIALDSNNYPAHQLLAQWYSALERLDEAESEIAHALALMKKSGIVDAAAFGQYGEILLQQKKYGDAKSQFENQYQLDSTSALACYKLASLYAVEQNAESSVRWIEKAFQKKFTAFTALEKNKLFNSVRMLASFKTLVERYQKEFQEELMKRVKQNK